MTLAAVMRRMDDWVLVAVACPTLAASCGLVAWSAAVCRSWPPSCSRGVSRACFWTGSQVHAVRGAGRVVVQAAGSPAGPALAGGLIQQTSP